ncbi:MAG: hypothetical protein JST39_16695 [Bacteroidetes bacterium]|nr:hypothetical protein [Bacteroidota bacterium]
MEQRKRNKLLLSALCLLLFHPGTAQKGFLYRAALDTVAQPGFYEIVLRPALAAQLQPGMQDIRIADANGRQVPYILKADIPSFSESRFREFPILSSRKEADKQTHVIIANNSGAALSELLLIIKNTDASRNVTLSGSDDSTHWYVIRENIALSHFFTTEGDHFVQALDFPLSNYRFFKVILNGKDLLPVNIVRAGVYEQSFINGRYLPLSRPRLLQKDSGDKYSYVFLRFDAAYFIDRLALQVSGPKFYKRTMWIYTGSIGAVQEVGSYIIQTDTPAVFNAGVKTDHLLLKIENDDNPPLHVDSVEAFQLNRYLYAWLEKGRGYSLLFGDSSATTPVYDLQYFKDSATGQARLLSYAKPVYNKREEKALVAGARSRWPIWVSLGVVSVLLLLLTAKMTRQINQRAE